MGKYTRITDLLITLISLASFAIYFLFPHVAFGSAIAKNRTLEFNLSEAIKIPAVAAEISTAGAPAIDDIKRIQYHPEAVIASLELEKAPIVQDEIPDETSALGANMKVAGKRWLYVTAYSSTPDQTDSTPFITASNTRVRDGIVAANFLPFGTKIRLPAIYPDKIFVVEDRMNVKHNQKVDIWFPSRQAALNFGIRWTEIEVLAAR